MGALFNQDIDLKLTSETPYLIQPSEPTVRRSMYLSNIDQSFNFHVKGLCFFSANPNSSIDTMVEMGRLTISKGLVPYDFLAGRLKLNEESGRLEIDCNGAGVSLVVATSRLTLEELGGLGINNPANKKLIPMPELEEQAIDQPLFAIKGTMFRCGSYVLGFSINHAALDGTGILFLLLNLSAVLAGQPLIIPPYTDRTILADRSPPRITYSHPYLITFHGDINRLPLAHPTPIINYNPSHQHLQFKNFNLNANNISFLKGMAKNADAGMNPKFITTFTVVAAHLWRSKALATNNDTNFNKYSRLTYTVNMRYRENPFVPISYAGNGILPAYARATCRELQEWPFSLVVELLGEAKERTNDDEYIRSMLDCGVDKGFPVGDVAVTSWMGMEFEELETGWGQLKYLCYLPVAESEVIVLVSGAEKGSVTALVGLSGDECMNKFHDLFYSPFVEPHA